MFLHSGTVRYFAHLRERPTKKKNWTCLPAPCASTRSLGTLQPACPARTDAPSTRSDELHRRAPTAHLRRAQFVLPLGRHLHPMQSESTHATRDARHAWTLAHSTCDRYLVQGWAPSCQLKKKNVEWSATRYKVLPLPLKIPLVNQLVFHRFARFFFLPMNGSRQFSTVSLGVSFWAYRQVGVLGPLPSRPALPFQHAPPQPDLT